MATMTLTAALVALAAMPAVAQQARCRALGEYQSEPMIFRCEGARLGDDGSASWNSFEILVPAGSRVNVVDIPAGTTDFTISMSSESTRQSVAGHLLVQDPASRDYAEYTMRDRPRAYQDDKFNAFFKNMTIDFREHLSLPRSEQVAFHGATPAPLRIVAENLENQDLLLKFKRYNYAPFISGPMCGFEKAAVGCDPYDQSQAREAVLEFCNKVIKTHPNASDAWNAIAAAGHLNPRKALTATSIPSYAWPKIWGMYSARPDFVWKAYKFITHGGFETNSKVVLMEDINFCYKMPQIHEFGQECCEHLSVRYKNASMAFAAQAQLARDTGKCVACGEGLFHMCAEHSTKNTTPARHDDYLDLYLDADGYQGLLAHDLKYCWGMMPMPAATGFAAPVFSPARAVHHTQEQVGNTEADTVIKVAGATSPAPQIAWLPSTTMTFLPDTVAASQFTVSAADQAPSLGSSGMQNPRRQSMAESDTTAVGFGGPEAQSGTPLLRAFTRQAPVEAKGPGGLSSALPLALGLSGCACCCAGLIVLLLQQRWWPKQRVQYEMAAQEDEPRHLWLPQE